MINAMGILDAEFRERIEEELPREKEKLSAATLDLRFRAKSLSASKRFAEAVVVKKLADDAAEKERTENRAERIAELAAERKKMTERHKKEVFVKEMAWQATISKMQMAAADEIRHAERTVMMLRARKSQQKLPPLIRARTAR
jgi:hypothetical protein